MTWFGLMWLIWSDLICLDAQLGTYQPPIPKTYQASAWSYLYIGRWMCKTECSPTGLGKKFVRSNSWKIFRQKWSISYLWEHFLVPDHQIPIWLWWTHQIHWNSIGFIGMLILELKKSLEFLRFHWHCDPYAFHGLTETIGIPLVLLTCWIHEPIINSEMSQTP